MIESGRIRFFARSRRGDGRIRDVGDAQQFLLSLQPDGSSRHRLLVVGQKQLPSPASGQRFWAFVDRVCDDLAAAVGHLGPTTYVTRAGRVRRRAGARLLGEGRYAIVRHEAHTHLDYQVEPARRIGALQRSFNIEASASYLITVRDPRKDPGATTALSPRQRATFPADLSERFGRRLYAPLDPAAFLDHRGAEVVLIAPRTQPAAAQPLLDLGAPARRFDVAVLGGVNTDSIACSEFLPRSDRPTVAESIVTAPGGKGANAAAGIAHQGGRVALIGAVGADLHGSEAVGALERMGVDVEHVLRLSGVNTGRTVTHLDAEARKQTAWNPGANMRLTPLDAAAAAELIGESRVLLADLEVPLECVLAAVRSARAHGLSIVIDAGPARDLPDELLNQATVVCANAREAGTITGARIATRADAERAAAWMISRGADAAAIAAPGGKLVRTRYHSFWMPDITVNTIDTTGAGDAFAGALALRLARGDRLEQATRYAHAASALATRGVGGQCALGSEEDVRRLMAIMPQAHGSQAA